MKLIAWVIPVIIMVQLVQGAIVRGDVYDYQLRIVNDALVTVNSTPRQQMISRNGYTFELSPGTYRIQGEMRGEGNAPSSDHEDITIADDGTYVIDLILLPDLENQTAPIDIPDVNIPTKTIPWWPFVVGVVIAAAIVVLATRKPRPKKLDGDWRAKAVQILKSEGGRMTQQELRGKMPLSEAKVSLIVSELEHDGELRKIKKGRGNILVLK